MDAHDECRVDDPDNIRVASGTLRLTVRQETEPFRCENGSGGYTTQYTAGAVSTGRNFSQTYGRFEMCARFPDAKVSGLHARSGCDRRT